MSLSYTTPAADDEPNSDFQVRLFGPFMVRVVGALMPPLRTRKGAWLFALLVINHDHPVERTWLAGALWPDSDHRESLKNLRDSLHDLRRALGSQESRIQAPTPRTLRLNLERADVDLLTFDAGLKRGDADSLARATAVYRGPLLEGCGEEWVVLERQRTQQACLEALEALAEIELKNGDLAEAVQHLSRCIGIDPFRETAQRALMNALAGSGDYGGVSQIYRQFRLLMHEDLQSQPAAETIALYQQITTLARVKGAAGVYGAVKSRQVVTRADAPHNLPPQLTSFVGRETAAAEILRLLDRTPLLTLTGAGGSGKTRLSLHVALEALANYPDGVWLVELASLSDPAQVAQKVAAVMDIREQPGIALHQTLQTVLKTKTMLLILDNCEHLIEPCGAVAAAILRSCPTVRLLATSRERLGIAGERTYRVPPLSVPDMAAPLTVETIRRCESVRLFEDRANLTAPEFSVCEFNAPVVANICCKLNGIPFAIELAAARLRSLSVENLQNRLGDLFHLLTGGDRSALPRQQTLRALIDWSYNLLSEPEKLLLQRLSVFAGGWSLEAAEAVCGSGSGAQMRTDSATSTRLVPEDVLDLLTSLVDKSLVVADVRCDSLRYSLLQMVRDYAEEKLTDACGAEPIRQAHRDYYLALAEEAEPHLTGWSQAQWLGRLEADHDNLCISIEQCRVEPEGSKAELRITSALWRYWQARAYLSVGRASLAAALQRGDALTCKAERAKALNGAGNLARNQGDNAEAKKLIEESLSIRRELTDDLGTAESLGNLANIARDLGDYSAAQPLFEESLSIRRALGDRWGAAFCLNGQGLIAHDQNELEKARSLYEESLALRRELGDRTGIANSLSNLGLVMDAKGDYGAAWRLHDESLSIRRELGDRWGIALSLGNLGEIAYERNEADEAQALYEISLTMRRELGDRAGVAEMLQRLGYAAHSRGDYDEAQTYYAESLTIYRELRHKWSIAVTASGAGDVECSQGRYEAATAFFKECLMLQQELGNKKGMVRTVEVIAQVAAATGRMDAAAKLLAAATVARSTLTAEASPDDLIRSEATSATVLSALGRPAFDEASRAGSLLSWLEVVSFALRTASSSEPVNDTNSRVS